jgi:DNA-binding NtrC family response regulator
LNRHPKKGEIMNKKNVLVVSNPETMNQKLLDWIGKAETLEMTFADTQEQAIELANQQLFDIVLIDRTDKDVNVKKLGRILPILNSEALLLGYEGEAADEIEEKIKLAFDYRKFKRMQRMMILDSSNNKNGPAIMPFSLN